MALGWGSVFAKIFDWFPNRRESKQSEIARLLRENEKLQQETPLSNKSIDRLLNNVSRIKLLREEENRIN